jgi:competence protein ComEA
LRDAAIPSYGNRMQLTSSKKYLSRITSRHVVVVVALVCAIVVGAMLLVSGPSVVSVAPAATLSSPTSSTVGERTPTQAPKTIVVSVVGKVQHPALFTIPVGSRVADAVTAAGGALAGTDLSTINLARKLVDGEQIVVGASVAMTGESAPPGPVNLNSATLEQLDALDGVGPVLAQRIMQWRTQHNGFTAISQLQQVSGMGQSKFARIKDQVSVE